jgi:hypothetical protein
MACFQCGENHLAVDMIELEIVCLSCKDVSYPIPPDFYESSSYVKPHIKTEMTEGNQIMMPFSKEKK